MAEMKALDLSFQGKKTACKLDLRLLRYGHFRVFCHSMGLIPLKYFCCVIEPPSIKPSIAGSITDDSFPLSSEAQLQTPEYLTTCIPVFWALLL